MYSIIATDWAYEIGDMKITEVMKSRNITYKTKYYDNI